jgi:hypothetical protein
MSLALDGWMRQRQEKEFKEFKEYEEFKEWANAALGFARIGVINPEA